MAKKVRRKPAAKAKAGRAKAQNEDQGQDKAQRKDEAQGKAEDTGEDCDQTQSATHGAAEGANGHHRHGHERISHRHREHQGDRVAEETKWGVLASPRPAERGQTVTAIRAGAIIAPHDPRSAQGTTKARLRAGLSSGHAVDGRGLFVVVELRHGLELVLGGR